MPPLPSKWKSEAEVPDWAKDAVVKQSDGSFVLDVSGMSPNAKVEEFRNNNTRLLTQLEELRAQLVGAKSAEEVSKLQTEIETLRERLEAGEDDKRVQELVSKRLVTVQIGDRAINVDRSHKAVFESAVKQLVSELESWRASNATLSSELTRERIEGGTRRAATEIPGVKPAAVDDIVLHVSQVFRMGDDHQPYLPDPDDKEGKLAKVGADGKPVTISGYLAAVKESGKKNGVWFDEPRGPKSIPRGSAPTGSGSEAFGQSRVRAALDRSGGKI